MNIDSIISRLLEGKVIPPIPLDSAPQNVLFSYLRIFCSARSTSGEKCATVRKRDSQPVPKVPRNIPVAADSSGVGGATEDLRRHTRTIL